VHERRGDDIAVQLVMLVTANTKRAAERIEDAAKLSLLAAQGEDLPARVQVRLAFLDQWNAVMRFVEGIAAAKVSIVGGVGRAHFSKPRAVERVRHVAVRRSVVAGAPAAAAQVKREPPIPDGDVTGGAAFRRAGTGIDGQRTTGYRDRRTGDLVGNDVNEPADRVGAEQERRRPTHDLDTRRGGRVHVDAMIAGLARQITHAQPIFDDQHAIAVESAHDRSGRTGTKAAQRDARLHFERGAERGLDLFRQLLSAEDVGRLKRFELALALRTDRRDLAEMQL